MDSGCSLHMCPFKSHLIVYQVCNGVKMMKRNNVVYKVVGIGNVRLKIHDESVIELRQVRHVPELKKKLISLGMIDQIGCIVRVQNGILSVIKGSQVLLRGARKNGLDILEGTTVTEEVFMSSSSSVDKTRLWHLRLGHMSLKD